MFTKIGDAQPIELIKLDTIDDQETKNKLESLKNDLSNEQLEEEKLNSKDRN